MNLVRTLVLLCLSCTISIISDNHLYADSARGFRQFSSLHKNTDAINAVLGDESFVKTFGIAPNPTTNETLRIRTHLAYVERFLRERDCSSLPPALRQRRMELLDKLHEYWLAGRFPVNEAYPNERRPCFIDRFGSICAVGYLIEQSMEHGAGRELAERINAHHQYEYIAAMTMPALAAWVAASGLTTEECAMIQPGYITPSSTTATGTGFQIRLHGDTGYQNVISISLGSTNLSIISASYSELRASVPPSMNIYAGNTPVIVTVSSGASFQYGILTFYKAPAPVILGTKPAIVTPGTKDFVLSILGYGFWSQPEVWLSDEPLELVSNIGGELRVRVPERLVAKTGLPVLIIRNPDKQIIGTRLLVYTPDK